MLTKDALRAAMALNTAVLTGILALCLIWSGSVLAVEQRGKPDFKKQSMTRSSVGPATRAAKPASETAATTRGAKRPATKASAAGLGRDKTARLEAPSTHRSSNPGASRQPATRSGAPSAVRAGQEAAHPPSARSVGTTETREARAVADEPAIRSVETGKVRSRKRTSADLDTARSAKPPLRATIPDAAPRQALAMRASPQAPSKRSAHAPEEHLSVRASRGTWVDWLFGR